MTKLVTTTPLMHNTAAGFQTWVTELAAMLDFMDLVKTADTGQINIPGIAAIPAANASAGYEIRALNDSASDTFPLVFKFEYGTNSTATNPQVWMTVGTGSDGAGNITGALIGRTAMSYNGNPGTTPTNLLSLACNVDAAKWGVFKFNYVSGQNFFYLFILRNVDENENVLDDAVTIVYSNNNTTTWNNYWRSTGGFASTTMANNKPNNLGTTIVNGAAQVWRSYMASPLWRPCVGLVWATSEVGSFRPYVVAPVKVNHTYIGMPYYGGSQEPAASGYSYSFIWE